MMLPLVSRWMAIALGFWLLFTLPMQAVTLEGSQVNLELGQTVFEAQCAGCHAQGGNIIRRGKTLKQAALQRNGYDSLATVVDLVTHGKSNMSAYRDRLTPDEIEAVSGYVLARASANWQPN